MRCPKFRNYDVSPGTNRKRGVKSRVKKLSVTRDQNSIFFLELDPIPFLGLDLIDPQSSFFFNEGLDLLGYFITFARDYLMLKYICLFFQVCVQVRLAGADQYRAQ